MPKATLKEKIHDYIFGQNGVSNPPEIIRIFGLCENMKWAHLPVAGGLYAQSPDFIDGITLIFDAKNRKAKMDIDKMKSEAEANRRKTSSKSR